MFITAAFETVIQREHGHFQEICQGTSSHQNEKHSIFCVSVFQCTVDIFLLYHCKYIYQSYMVIVHVDSFCFVFIIFISLIYLSGLCKDNVYFMLL